MLLLAAAFISGTVTVLAIIYLQPKPAFHLASRLFPDVLFWCPPAKESLLHRKVVALSIDDGPTTNLTNEILDVLQEGGATATFFLIGDHIVHCNKEPSDPISDKPLGDALIERMHAEGHEVANHTWYDRPSIRLDMETFTTELVALDRMLFPPDSAQEIKWFRPGGGWFSKPMVQAVQKHGYKVALGCVHPFDVNFKSPSVNAWHVSTRVYPGAVIVLHDGPGRDHTIPTLRKLLPALKANGYTVTTLSKLYAWSQTGQLPS